MEQTKITSASPRTAAIRAEFTPTPAVETAPGQVHLNIRPHFQPVRRNSVQAFFIRRDGETIRKIAFVGGSVFGLMALAAVAALTLNSRPENGSQRTSPSATNGDTRKEHAGHPAAPGPLVYSPPHKSNPGSRKEPAEFRAGLFGDSPVVPSPVAEEVPDATSRVKPPRQEQATPAFSGTEDDKRQGTTSEMTQPSPRDPEPIVLPPAGESTTLPPPTTTARSEAGTLTDGRNLKRRAERLLIVSEDGVAAVRENEDWQPLEFPPDFVPKQILWSHVDRDGACWLSGHGGLAQLDGERIAFLGAADGLPDQPLSHVFEDSQGRLWVSSWGGGVALREQGVWRRFTTRDGLRHDDVNGCAEDSQGRIWIVGDAGKQVGGHGVTLFAGQTFESGGVGSQLAVNVMSIDGDQAGSIYLGCIGGLLAIAADSQIHRLTPSQGLPQRTPQATYVDSRGRVWAGTWGGGVVQVDIGRQTVLTSSALSEAKHVRRITEDNHGAIWVASLEGLWCLRDRAWQRIPLPPQINKVSVVATIPAAIASQLARLTTLPVMAAGTPPTNSTPAVPEPPATPPGASASPTPPQDSSASPTSFDHLSQYLAANGHLTGDLWLDVQYRVPATNVNGIPVAAQIRIVLSVFADGRWQTDGGITVAIQGRSVEKSLGLQQGRMTAEELRHFATTLAAQDLLTLPSRVSPESSALFNRNSLWASTRVRFRSRTCQATFVCSALDQHVVRTSTVSGKTIFERLDRLCAGILAATPVWSKVMAAGQDVAEAQ